MEGFGWRRRESGKKLTVMSGYEWLRMGSASERMGLEEKRPNGAKGTKFLLS
jgi:hypothetical protein